LEFRANNFLELFGVEVGRCEVGKQHHHRLMLHFDDVFLVRVVEVGDTQSFKLKNNAIAFVLAFVETGPELANLECFSGRRGRKRSTS